MVVKGNATSEYIAGVLDARRIVQNWVDNPKTFRTSELPGLIDKLIRPEPKFRKGQIVISYAGPFRISNITWCLDAECWKYEDDYTKKSFNEFGIRALSVEDITK